MCAFRAPVNQPRPLSFVAQHLFLYKACYQLPFQHQKASVVQWLERIDLNQSGVEAQEARPLEQRTPVRDGPDAGLWRIGETWVQLLADAIPFAPACTALHF